MAQDSRPSKATLKSPGRMTSQRDRAERLLARQTAAAFDSYLRTLPATSLTADPSAITLGTLIGGWQAAAHQVMTDSTLLATLPDMQAAQVTQRLLLDRTPTDVFDALHDDDPSTTAATALAQARTRISRTEATTAFALGSLSDFARAGLTGKRWVSHHDRLTRDTHLAANGQTVPLGVDFIVGGYAGAVPGDPALPPGERMNCRCVMVGVTL